MKTLLHRLFALLLFAMLGVVVMRELGPSGSGTELPDEHSQQLFADLGAAAAAVPIVVFVTDWCPVCRALERDLTSRGIKYVAADVEKDRAAFLHFNRLTGGKGGGVPMTVVGNRVFVGYNLRGILSAIEERSVS